MIESFSSVSLTDFANVDSAATLVLTVNNRYARRIIAGLSASLNEGQRAMVLPDIVPVSAWLRQAGDSLSFNVDGAVASHTVDAFGAQILWQHTIEEIESESVLLNTSQAARLAMDADRLISDWRIDVLPAHETGDYQRFRLWRQRYREKLAQLDAEDSTLGIERIVDAATHGTLEFPYATVILAGFNELSPRLADMIGAMQRQGVQIRVLQTHQQSAGCVQRILAADPDAEWRLAAQWAALQLQQNPRGCYAIVAPHLEADVVLAHRTLREALPTDSTGQPMPYNIAVARPLADWPLVRAALAWLRLLAELATKRSSTPALAGEALLAGGCIAQSAELSGRAAIDAWWRRQGSITVSSQDLVDCMARMAPQLGVAWQACLDECRNHGPQATIDQWAAQFRRYLELLGFPGHTGLDSTTYQALEAFDAALDRLAAQSPVLGRIGLGSAVALLARLVRETPFQPQRDPLARLDVLGFLESEGGRWDGAWVLGLTDDVLPAAASPNPLIPLATLRQASAPRATPERELQWAQSMIDALLCCAPQIWVSHAEYEGETALRSSPYIDALPAMARAPEPLPNAACRLERLIDEQGPPLRAGTTTRGGINVIDTQARNPLWAFVKYRLGAAEMNDYANMVGQNARGMFLHRAIELIWRMIPDQDGLRQMVNGGRLAALLAESIQQSAGECLRDYGKVLKELEMARATAVLHEWLMRELEREPFTIDELEKTFAWSCGSLELNVRLDRIDRLSDGRVAVIDYKSGGGKISPQSDWARPRPVNVQLPFYSAVVATQPSTVAALVLARLHARNMEVSGLCDEGAGFAGLSRLADWPALAGTSWPALMARWRQTIEDLAREYSAGVARNQTFLPSDVDYCDVIPFLRLNEEAGRAD